MSDKDPKQPQLSPSQGSYDVRINEAHAELSPAGLFARDANTSTGLVWGYRGGRWGGVLIDNDTLTLTGSATNYVVVSKASGVVSVSTSSSNWNSRIYARLYKITTGASTVTDYEDHRAGIYGSNSGGGDDIICIPVAVGDEVSALTTGTGKVTFRMPFGMQLTEIRGSLTTAATGGTLLTVDVNESGSTILSTKLTFDASEKTTKTAATPAVISDAALADDAEITIDIDAVGSTLPGAGLKVYLIGRKA